MHGFVHHETGERGDGGGCGDGADGGSGGEVGGMNVAASSSYSSV